MQAESGLPDYYAVLGVSRSASALEIRAAYLRLATKWHTHKQGKEEAADGEGAIARFQQVHRAYKVLSDPAKRAMYDAGLYDPSADDEDVKLMNDFLGKQLVATMDKHNEESRKKRGNGSSSSSSSPVVRTFTNAGSGTPAAGGTSHRSGSSSSRARRRRPAPSPFYPSGGLRFGSE